MIIKKAQITIVKNGPMIVEGVTRYIDANGSMREMPDVYKLCRCGASFEKPHCDGSHEIFDFDDRKSPYRVPDHVDEYPGEDITVYFNRGVCSHRGICYEELPTVFSMEKKAPVTPDNDTVDRIIDICQRCPSGALSYRFNGGERRQECDVPEPVIRVAPKRYGFDGPYEIAGGVKMVDDDGNRPESIWHYAICRCGQSKNLPFCSGEHWAAQFLDESVEEEESL